MSHTTTTTTYTQPRTYTTNTLVSVVGPRTTISISKSNQLESKESITPLGVDVTSNCECKFNCKHYCIDEKLKTESPIEQEQEQEETEKPKCDECTICYEPLDGTNVATMDCGHTFHYKCIFRWNLTNTGDMCPLCRCDLGLPDIESDSSDSESEASEFDTDSEFEVDNEESGDTENPSVNEYRRDLRSRILLDKQKKALSFYLSTLKGGSTSIADSISITCNTCNYGLVTCEFCSHVFCSCKTLNGGIQTAPNPFNKFYNTVFERDSEDPEFCQKLVINPETLESSEKAHSHICARCFTSRDYLLWASLKNNEETGEEYDIIPIEQLNAESVKFVYYNLYYNNSGINQGRLYEPYESFDTLDGFKQYAIEKYNLNSDTIQIPPTPPPVFRAPVFNFMNGIDED